MKNDKVLSIMSFILLLVGFIICFIIPARNIHLIIFIVFCIISLILAIIAVIKERKILNIAALVISALVTIIIIMTSIFYYQRYFESHKVYKERKEYLSNMEKLEKEFSDDVEYTVSLKQLEGPSLNNKVVISRTRYEDFIKIYNVGKPYSEQLASPFGYEFYYCDGYVVVTNKNNNISSKAYLSCNSNYTSHSYTTKGYDESLQDPINIENYLSVYIRDKNTINGTEYKITNNSITKNSYENSILSTQKYTLEKKLKKDLVNLMNIYNIVNWKNNSTAESCSFEKNNALFSISIVELNRSTYYCIPDNETNDNNLEYANNIISLIENYINNDTQKNIE